MHDWAVCVVHVCLCVHYVCVRFSQAHFQMHSELRINIFALYFPGRTLLLCLSSNFLFISLFQSYFNRAYFLLCTAPCHLYVLFIQPFHCNILIYSLLLFFFIADYASTLLNDGKSSDSMEEFSKRTINRRITIGFSDIY